MTRDEFLDLIRPHLGDVQKWFRDALSRDQRLNAADTKTLVDMRPVTRGNLIRDLTIGEARRSETPKRRVVTVANGAEVIELDTDHGPAVHLRYRRASLELIDGEFLPGRPVQLTDAAALWLDNAHLKHVQQTLPIAPPDRPVTHVLLARVDDLSPDGQAPQLHFACWLGSTLQWSVDLSAELAKAEAVPLRAAATRRTHITPRLGITPKIADEQQ